MSQHRSLPSWEPLSGMNLTPMINVVFVLLMVAFVLTPAMSGPQLPDARSSHAIDSVGVTVGVDHAGHIWLNDGTETWRVAPTDLAERLRQSFAGQTTEHRVLYLRAEPMTSYRSISPVLRAAREAGIRRLGLLTDRQ